MPYSTLILTSGISAFTPRNVFGVIFRKPGAPLGFPDKQQNPVPLDSSLDDPDLERQCRNWLSRHIPETPDSSAISAEFSLLHALNRQGSLSPGAFVHLIHTPTPGGRLAVALQLPMLESRLNIQAYPCELSVPFEPSLPGGLALASGAFIGVVSRLLRGLDPRSAAFAPIGGYKAMVALGHTAASFHGFPSLYLHEDSQVLQEIAPAPIAIPPEVHVRLAAIARRVGNGAEWQALAAADRTLIEAHPAFFSRLENLVELNELGQYLRLDSLPILLSPEAEAERIREPRLLDGQIRQIAALAMQNINHPGINHDLRGTPGRTHPWRLAQMGDFVRIAWQLTPAALVVGKIWRDHGDYDDEVVCFVQRPLPKDPAAYHPLP